MMLGMQSQASVESGNECAPIMKKTPDTLSSSSRSSAAADAPERSDVDGIRNELLDVYAETAAQQAKQSNERRVPR